MDGVGYREGELEKGGKRNGWSSVARRIRERNEKNFIQEKGKENERKLGKEIEGGESEEGRRRFDIVGYKEGELELGAREIDGAVWKGE